MLEKPKEPIISEAEETRQDTPEQTGQDEPKPKKAGFWKRLFKGEL
jgi:hypothetical protein